MSQVDKLFDEMSEDEVAVYTSGSETEPHIVIGRDRIVVVPEELKRIGVQHDHNIETLTFDCPRYWDEHDLLDLKLYVHYRRSDGYLGKFLCKNVVVDSVNTDIIHFDWTVSRNVTFVAGSISFLACAKDVNSNGIEEVHWNSELNMEAYVSEGLECTDVEDQDPDIITQLLIRMDETEEMVRTSDILTAVEYYQESEEDRQELHTKVDNLLNAKGGPSSIEEYDLTYEFTLGTGQITDTNKLVGSITSNGVIAKVLISELTLLSTDGGVTDIHLGDWVLPDHLKSYGRYEFMLSDSGWMFYIDHGNYGFKSEGDSSNLTGTFTNDVPFYYHVENPSVHFEEVVDLRLDVDGAVHDTAGDAVRAQVNSLREAVSTVQTELQDQIDEIETPVVDIVHTEGDREDAVMSQKTVSRLLSNSRDRIELIEQMNIRNGTIAETSGTYSVRETADGANIINGAETNVRAIKGNSSVIGNSLIHSTIEKIISYGRNFIRPSYTTAVSNGITYTVGSDFSIQASGTATNKSYFTLMTLTPETVPAGTYSISGNAGSFTFLIEGFRGSTWVKQLLNGNGSFTVDYNGYDRVTVRLYLFTGLVANHVMYPMLNRGGKSLPYEPYVSDEFSLPSETELKKYDYIDVSNGKIIRKSYFKSFTGVNENWKEIANPDGSVRFGITVPNGVSLSGVCNVYDMGETLSYYLALGSGAVFFGTGQANLQFIDSSCANLDEWKAHLVELSNAGTPLTFVLESGTATEESIDIQADSYIAYRNGTELVVGDGEVTVEQIYLCDMNTDSAGNSRPAIITFIDDDGAPESLRNWELIGDAAGIKNTFAMVTSRSDIDWDEIERLQNKGHEFISHTHTHPRLNDLTEEELINEFKTSTGLLHDHGCESRYLVYPYNSCNGFAVQYVKQYFRAGILGEDKINTTPITPFTIKRHNVLSGLTETKEINGVMKTVSSFKTFDQFKAIIDETIQNNGWCVFMSHLFANDTSGYYCDADARGLLVEVCKYAVKNGAKIEPFGKAFEICKNRLDVGSLTDSSYCIVDCDGVVYEK